MSRQRNGLFGLMVCVVVLAAGPARGQETLGHFQIFRRFHLERRGTPPPGRPRVLKHTDERAGYPRCQSDHLEPSVTPGGIGYYVGGGVPLARGQGRCMNQGTWGWDETGGLHLRRRVILGWSQGRRYQGGTGAYRTDGPVIPDLVYASTTTLQGIQKRLTGRGSGGSTEHAGGEWPE